jgi:hypothetical protein
MVTRTKEFSMNGFKKNKNQQNNMGNKPFDKENATKQQEPMKKEFGNTEKSTGPSNGMMKKNTPSSNDKNNNSSSQNKAGFNKYFSNSEKKSSDSKETYKKNNNNGDDNTDRDCNTKKCR